MQQAIDDEISFRKLGVLLAFLEEGSLQKSADRLGISTVSVHRALHSLESGLRCSLFRLEGRNLQPTPAAHALADTAREVLSTMAAGIRTTREVAGYSSDRIRIGSLYSLTIRTVPAVLMKMRERMPDLETELVLGSNADLLQKLRNGDIDAALMSVPEGENDMVSEPLFKDTIQFAAPVGTRYADLDLIDLSECAKEHFVSLKEGFATYNGFVEAFRVAGFTPNVVMQTGDIFSLMSLVSGGVGFTLLPGRVGELFPHKVKLIPLQPEYSMRQTLGLSFLGHRERDPNLLALLAVCRSSKSELG